jgi:tRNA threonylcarbamoyladenosine biosynthesis protein TsaE
MDRPKTFLSHSAAETIQYARTLAAKLKPGDVLALTGDLGSGKTTFIKGIAAGLGLADTDQVKSPTFALMHIYPSKIKLYHFDLYRLEKESELHDIGFEEYVNDPSAISCVEWAEKAGNLIPERIIKVSIRLNSSQTRNITVIAT